jgi:hypothetical protein
MNLLQAMRSGGRHILEGEPDEVQQRLRAKLAADRVEWARGNSKHWTEIDGAALVRRGPYRVDADSDAVYLPRVASPYATGRVHPDADAFSPLFFTVGPENELLFFEREAWGWSERLERKAKRDLAKRAARRR